MRYVFWYNINRNLARVQPNTRKGDGGDVNTNAEMDWALSVPQERI